MNLRPAAAFGILLLLSACAESSTAPPLSAIAPPPAAQGTMEFRTTDFAWSTAPGQGQVQGRLAYKVAKTAYTCAEVVLTPETPWVRRRMEILYLSSDKAALPAAEVRGRTPPERSQDYSAFARRTPCDPSGNFVFTGLPDGAWYVITVAKPKAPDTGADVAIMRRVETRSRLVKVSL